MRIVAAGPEPVAFLTVRANNALALYRGRGWWVLPGDTRLTPEGARLPV